MKSAYTLLADDNLPISSNQELEKKFLAHVIYGCLTNQRLVFSDNQIINSYNLRSAVETKDSIRRLIQEKVLAFALRQQAPHAATTENRLRQIEEAFKTERKYNNNIKRFDTAKTLDFIENNGLIIDWKYQDVRLSFTERCKQTFKAESTRDVLGEELFKVVNNEIIEEEERSTNFDKGLGRQFLQFDLIEKLKFKGFELSIMHREYLRDCSEGPYLSNLPSVLGLDPIYETRHRSAFDLMRGVTVENLSEELPQRAVRARLTSDFFIEGLIRFDADDIFLIRNTPAYKSFIELSSQTMEFTEAAVYDVALAFEELTIEIEDRMIQRFPELGLHSSVPDERKLRLRWANLQRGASMAFDIINLTLTTAGLPSIPGIGQDIILTEARRRTIGSEQELSIKESARRRLSLNALSRWLQKEKLHERLDSERDVAFFDKQIFDETIVASKT